MTIVGCRIDGRLIHGQVANLWAGKLNVSRIMVVDDEVVNNDVEKEWFETSDTTRCEIKYFCQLRKRQPIFLLVNTIANVSLSLLVNQTVSLVW